MNCKTMAMLLGVLLNNVKNTLGRGRNIKFVLGKMSGKAQPALHTGSGNYDQAENTNYRRANVSRIDRTHWLSMVLDQGGDRDQE
jgi:hypothetical protein